MKILVTGGCDYIGSYACVKLINEGYMLIILDNHINSKVSVISLIKVITNQDAIFYQGEVQDNAYLERIFSEYHATAIIHFSGLKSVGQ